MLTEPASRLATAFGVAAAELGHWSASWLFVRELSGGGEPAIARLRDELGRTFPVLDTVARQWLEGQKEQRLETEGVLAACEGASRILVCGIESDALDALCAKTGRETRIGVVQLSTSDVDWDRFLANYGGRIEGVELTRFQLWAGHRSVLVTFAYGTREHATHVDPSAARVLGPDVRMQFRAVLAWEVLRSGMYVYPRWVTDVPIELFSDVV